MKIEEIGLEIHDVVNGNTDRLDDLINLYQDLFPEYARYVPVMRRRAEQPVDVVESTVVHQWLATINNQAAGMLIFKYNVKRNCGIGLDLAVSEKFKKIKFKGYERLAHLLIDLRQTQIEQDAKANGKKSISGVVVEVESRRLMDTFEKYGLVELDVKYQEPPAPESAKPLIDADSLGKVLYKPMILGVYPMGVMDFDVRNYVIIKEFVKALLVDHYGLTEDHWVVVDALKSIVKDA
jgi:hypothetical protein